MTVHSKRKTQLSAQDVMTRGVLAIPQRMSLRGAARLLARSGMSSAPVTNASGGYVGWLPAAAYVCLAAETDPGTVKHGSMHHCAWSEWQLWQAESTPCEEVSKHVRRDIPVVRPQAPLAEVVQKMLQADSLHAVVVDERSRPLGLVSGPTLLRVLGRETGLTEQPLPLRSVAERRYNAPRRLLRETSKH